MANGKPQLASNAAELDLPPWYPRNSNLRAAIRGVAEELIRSFEVGGKLLLCGNGGSAADCDHIAGELIKSFRAKRPLSPEQSAELEGLRAGALRIPVELLQQGLPAINLAAPSATLTAVTNDTAGEMVFAQQVIALGKKGDVFCGISTSGSSRNVVYAAAIARRLGLVVVSFTGAESSVLGDCSDVCVSVPESDTARIQELHLPAYHAICDVVERTLFP